MAGKQEIFELTSYPRNHLVNKGKIMNELQMSFWLWLSKHLPVVPFARLNKEETNPEDFCVPRIVLHRNPAFRRWMVPVEIDSSLIILSAANNPVKGWHGYVILPDWVVVGPEDKDLENILRQVIGATLEDPSQEVTPRRKVADMADLELLEAWADLDLGGPKGDEQTLREHEVMMAWASLIHKEMDRRGRQLMADKQIYSVDALPHTQAVELIKELRTAGISAAETPGGLTLGPRGYQIPKMQRILERYGIPALSGHTHYAHNQLALAQLKEPTGANE